VVYDTSPSRFFSRKQLHETLKPLITALIFKSIIIVLVALIQNGISNYLSSNFIPEAESKK
jgi:hypothetical protein